MFVFCLFFALFVYLVYLVVFCLSGIVFDVWLVGFVVLLARTCCLLACVSCGGCWFWLLVFVVALGFVVVASISFVLLSVCLVLCLIDLFVWCYVCHGGFVVVDLLLFVCDLALCALLLLVVFGRLLVGCCLLYLLDC